MSVLLLFSEERDSKADRSTGPYLTPAVKSFAFSNSFDCHCVPPIGNGPSLHRMIKQWGDFWGSSQLYLSLHVLNGFLWCHCYSWDKFVFALKSSMKLFASISSKCLLKLMHSWVAVLAPDHTIGFLVSLIGWKIIGKIKMLHHLIEHMR